MEVSETHHLAADLCTFVLISSSTTQLSKIIYLFSFCILSPICLLPHKTQTSFHYNIAIGFSLPLTTKYYSAFMYIYSLVKINYITLNALQHIK